MIETPNSYKLIFYRSFIIFEKMKNYVIFFNAFSNDHGVLKIKFFLMLKIFMNKNFITYLSK